MTTYRDVQGYRIRSVASNPDNPKTGQIWYNRSTKQITVRTESLATFASGGNINTGRGNQSLSPVGTQTAGLLFGGQNDGLSPPKRGETEEYNGSSWSEQNDLNTDRYRIAGCGTQTAALGAAGYTLPGQTAKTEEYNGSSWSEQNDLSAVRAAASAAGTQTAAVCIGGSTYTVPEGSILRGYTEEYDGSSWTTANSIAPALAPAPRVGVEGHGCCGTQTAALVIGGNSSTITGQTLEYDGTNYSNSGALTRGINGGWYFGIQTDAVCGGGSDTAGNRYVNDANTYDGTSWSSIPATLAVAREQPGSGGNSTAGMVFAGFQPGSPSYALGTEEFTGQVIATKTLDVS